MEWYYILAIVLGSIIVWFLLSALFYKQFFKRFYDVIISGIAIIILSPLFIILTIVGTIAMKGNPFFTQLRPGKNEKIFKLIKFRTMTNEKDKDGNLLPDEKRLIKYGKFLRSTSLDELPELFNIFFGHMSIVGPRPLLVKYLSLYNDFQRKRHYVRPGLTGLAQINGRNSIDWNDRFKFDIDYVNNISLINDLKIIILTVKKVFIREGISSNNSVTMEEFKGNEKNE